MNPPTTDLLASADSKTAGKMGVNPHRSSPQWSNLETSLNGQATPHRQVILLQKLKEHEQFAPASANLLALG
jgi:hypothetical protein